MSRKNQTYLDERLGALEEMLPALGFGAFLMPIYNSLIGNTILVIQNLHKVLRPRYQTRQQGALALRI
jgi:hypothetical protein